MTATLSNINYWRWREPSGSETPVRQPSLPGDGSLPEPRELSRTELLQEDFLRKPGIHVVFMPNVESGILKMAGSADLCRQLTEKFFLPKFFFERLGWNANGMFGSTSNLLQTDSETSYGTFSRFLSKQVKGKGTESRLNSKNSRSPNPISTPAPEYEYDWHYMAFCTMWRSSLVNHTAGSGQPRMDGSSDETHVLLCFDLDDDITFRLRRLLHKADLRDWNIDPFLMLEYALHIVIEQCEQDLWSFQKPVRDIEKGRGQELFRETGSSDNDKTFEFLVERYSRLHELSRHVIHISESMDATSNNLAAIVRDHNLWMSTSPYSAATTRLSKALLLHENMITNLNFRAKAFVGRMDNEIKCASNFVAVADSNISKGILKQTRNEGKVLSDTVSALTLLFLPGTFISGFFGMNFFTLDQNDHQILQWKAHPKIWIFFVCTIPITILGFFVFMLEFNFLTWIRDMQALIGGIFRRRKTSDVENMDLKGLKSSDRSRKIQRSFGFSRRATSRSMP
ncbi:hypothetical protein PENFLA_c020G01583 [Penicillium flavigenum]|uniref:Uncharacterized protein n=1 Tax=Penicillium flavigenum TaxID=254877 RepID=A0A1V6SY54_9EURO|nr:hypothetical protein PENFLA_c020G01583 [Penicillium flavigenum]